jgi:hypothetical protein
MIVIVRIWLFLLINLKSARCVFNATNAPACSQSFKLMPYLIFSKFKGVNCQKSLDKQFQPNKSLRMETENFIFFCNCKRDNFVKINE